ncbi:Type IV conjugative transfer system TraK-like protein (plasmid) [Candidatus Trichorickettsia mobilis]|uniref:TraK domain-containing protein n=1 Tax=Candidatus Trichorickettsia mobilis TaxID=1346319 RepID=UPI002B263E77|nr:type-F conjugative transfer system secretin TraK [Candidatus Trichorickettsia mobilis]WPY01624.1 Type IV conjugative transfer system TraK-like protein [Candidatus Trichorickettsia mobilis]
MDKATHKILKQIIYSGLFLYAHIASGETYQAQPNEPLQIKISKSGLNRISNPPYKITQVTGDDSKFRLKYDEDGTNIYFMPLITIGENVEISIRNNAGITQDLELQVSDIKGKSIIIDGKTNLKLERIEKSDIAEMLRAMKDNVQGKFYVQNTKQQKLKSIGILKVEQSKIYKYKNLAGGVFEITNPTKNPITLDVSIFARSFDNVKSFYPNLSTIEPSTTITVLVVQKVAGK